MVILVDTNILVDVLMKRKPYMQDAEEILTKCALKEITGYIAAHSIPNLFYILRKSYSREERRAFIKDLCSIFHISALTATKILSAAENEKFSDFEDCLQEECAVEAGADYIVTRNPDDFITSRVKVVRPGEFLDLIKGSCNSGKGI